ncbi:MAG: DUF4394 domain-containing protein [Acidobacteria bacterium]|nr:DUF4394 domain-containing protein [Acidobacteriota bacterium]
MSRKFYITLTITVLALSAISVYGLIGSRRVVASTSVSATAAVQTLPSLRLYTLTTDNVINVLIPGTTIYFGLGRVPNTYGSVIGIDFRPADPVRTNLYAITDRQRVILIDLNNVSATPKLISTLSPRFSGGFQSLMDFNPVVDAIRIIGSNRQNFAVVNANGGTLNSTVVQTAVAYAAGDVNAAQTPYLCGGAYTNNVAGAATTIFYAFDYNTDQLVTVPVGANGSSATGGGQLQTIGSIINQVGNRVRLTPLSDFDITTDAYGRNTLIGVTGSNSMVIIDLSQINPSLPLGRTQTVVARTTNLLTLAGDMPTDFAIQLRPATVATR